VFRSRGDARNALITFEHCDEQKPCAIKGEELFDTHWWCTDNGTNLRDNVCCHLAHMILLYS